jgi:tRNA(Arg) A34 adenosine deaminase TadA
MNAWAALGADGQNPRDLVPADQADAFSCAVLTLLERVSSADPQVAIRRLRQPLWSPEPLSLRAKAGVKVLAKRWRRASPPHPPSVLLTRPAAVDALLAPDGLGSDAGGGLSFPCHGADHLSVAAKDQLRLLESPSASDATRLMVLDHLTSQATRRERSVAALLLDDQGHVLRLAFNRPDAGHVWHAEYLCLRAQQASGQPIPHGSRMLVTRKPCRMCAAIVVHCLGSCRMLVCYLHDDPGPFAALTILDAGSGDRRDWLESGLGCSGRCAQVDSFCGHWEERLKPANLAGARGDQ